MTHLYSYDNVVSLTEREFRKKTIQDADLKNPEKFTKSNSEEVETIERLLDLKSAVLKSEEFYLQKSTCQCGHTLTMKILY